MMKQANVILMEEHDHEQCAYISQKKIQNHNQCRNPNLGLATKARACKRVRQEGDPGGTSYIPRSAGECEKMNPHTPKATLTWGVGVPKDFRIFTEHL
jgi:hypothetical protein